MTFWLSALSITISQSGVLRVPKADRYKSQFGVALLQLFDLEKGNSLKIQRLLPLIQGSHSRSLDGEIKYCYLAFLF